MQYFAVIDNSSCKIQSRHHALKIKNDSAIKIIDSTVNFTDTFYFKRSKDTLDAPVTYHGRPMVLDVGKIPFFSW